MKGQHSKQDNRQLVGRGESDRLLKMQSTIAATSSFFLYFCAPRFHSPKTPFLQKHRAAYWTGAIRSDKFSLLDLKLLSDFALRRANGQETGNRGPHSGSFPLQHSMIMIQEVVDCLHKQSA
jgi:hypothetical protein